MLLGLCPALAITTTVSNALAMGLSVLFVLLSSGLVLSLLRSSLPKSASPYAELVIIAVFVTIVELVLGRFGARVSRNLGIYLPLVVVNCLILNHAKGSASKKAPADATIDALSVGMGFLLSLTLIALIREILGSGTITLFPIGEFTGVIRVANLSASPARVMILSAGAFLVLGYLMALINVIGFAGNPSSRVRDSAQPTTMEKTTRGPES